jgi:hypothetical protein
MGHDPAKGLSLTTGTLLRIFFGLAAIAFVIYCFYLGFVPDFGFAIIVLWSVIFAAIISFVELIWGFIRR